MQGDEGQKGAAANAVLVEAFARFAGGKGHLTRHELKCAYTAVLGSRPSKPQINLLLRDAVQGEDGEPTLSWQAFQAHMQALPKMQDPDEHIRQVFKAFDTTSCGFISRAAAHAAFRNAAPSASLRVVDEVFDELDLDADGRVGCRDFITMMRMRGLG